MRLTRKIKKNGGTRNREGGPTNRSRGGPTPYSQSNTRFGILNKRPSLPSRIVTTRKKEIQKVVPTISEISPEPSPAPSPAPAFKPNPIPITPPMDPKDYPSELRFLNKELFRVEKERDDLVTKLENFDKEVKSLKIEIFLRES